MAYTDDGVLAKLSALNETQESIVTVAQWVMFHRRHAERTVQLWFQRLKDSGANKRLNLIYLVNEVVQQSKARRKNDFLVAFSPIITEATAVAYRGATNEVQQKLRRVVEVWRQRQIFELPIQEAMESRIGELDKSRASGKKPLFGGSLSQGSSGTVPPEMQPLVSLQAALSKLASGKASALAGANTEYDKLNDPAASIPTPPVHAARLSGLLKSLANAEGAVAESIKARQALIEGLEKVLDKNRNSLQGEESEQVQLASRKATIEAKKREVEDGIMRGLAEESVSVDAKGDSKIETDPTRSQGAQNAPSAEPEPPVVEGLSPPSVEALTPGGTPPDITVLPATATSTSMTEGQPDLPEPLPSLPAPALPPSGADLLSSLAMPKATPLSVNGSSAKKRKIDETDEFAVLGSGDAMEGLDEDVKETLRRDSGIYQ